MKGRVIYFLMVLVMGYTGSATAAGPIGVSPGGEGSIAVINQECPTFSWSQVEGAISYRVKVFERVNGEILSYEEIDRTGEPVMSVEIKAPAFSWTPSAGECLETGKGYVWYVVARQDSGRENSSEGRRFEVEAGASAGIKEVLQERVKDYLVKEWKETESYKEVKETIKAEMVKEIKESGRKAVGLGSPVILESETGVNTLFGFQAGNSLGDDDDYATFIGYRAGYNTADGTGLQGKDNTFVGYRAGYANTTGYINTFLGREAGFSNTTGETNVFLGSITGYSNISGSANTFVGSYAGSSNTTGGWNAFLGREAGNSNTTGVQNTFVGFKAGKSNTEGMNNTYLGTYAGLNATGSRNVFLGYNVGSNEPGSDKLFIDNSSISTPLIYGEFNNNLLVINGVLSVASSREYKEKIDQLKPEKAVEALEQLNPVEFSYKVTPSERHMGFISEEVPESLTSRDRKAVNPMDIVAVLTKVVQEQQKTISTLREELNELKERVR